MSAQFPHEQADDGRFVRQEDAFRHWVRADGSIPVPRRGGTVSSVRFAGLSVGASHDHRAQTLWGSKRPMGMTRGRPDPRRAGLGLPRRARLHERPDQRLRLSERSVRRQRPSIPWPGHGARAVGHASRSRIVNNSEDDIMRMFETEFVSLSAHPVDLYPPALRAEIDALNALIYETSTTASTAPASPPASARTSAQRASCSKLSTCSTTGSRAQRYLFGRSPGRNGLALIRHVGPFRSRVLRPLQVQPARDRAIPEPRGATCATSTKSTASPERSTSIISSATTM